MMLQLINGCSVTSTNFSRFRRTCRVWLTHDDANMVIMIARRAEDKRRRDLLTRGWFVNRK